MPGMTGEPDGWRKSTRSADAGNCVEAGQGPGVIAVRDSKDPDRPVLTFSPSAWAAFTVRLKGC